MRDLSVQIKNMEKHIEADELIRGTGFEGGKGCFVGCTIDAYDHAACEAATGVPEWVWYLCDNLHECMSDDVDRGDMALGLLRGFEKVEDFEVLRHDILAYIQSRNLARVKALEIDDDLKTKIISAIESVLALHRSYESQYAAWSAAMAAVESARSAARSAEFAAESAGAASWSAARSVEFAARAAAESAARSAESAGAASWSAARPAAWFAEFDAIGRHLLHLLEKGAPKGEEE